MQTCACCEQPMMELDDDRPTEYQYEDALWIGFHGGYGMFVDNLEARLPVNTEDRWLRDPKTGEYLTVEDARGGVQPIDNNNWEPEYREERLLPGQPDYEAVICHDCAHKLCDDQPWIAKLLVPYTSHAHRQWYHDLHPDHRGWDYEPRIQEEMRPRHED